MSPANQHVPLKCPWAHFFLASAFLFSFLFVFPFHINGLSVFLGLYQYCTLSIWHYCLSNESFCGWVRGDSNFSCVINFFNCYLHCSNALSYLCCSCQLVKDVVVPLLLGLGRDAGLLQQVILLFWKLKQNLVMGNYCRLSKNTIFLPEWRIPWSWTCHRSRLAWSGRSEKSCRCGSSWRCLF